MTFVRSVTLPGLLALIVLVVLSLVSASPAGTQGTGDCNCTSDTVPVFAACPQQPQVNVVVGGFSGDCPEPCNFEVACQNTTTVTTKLPGKFVSGTGIPCHAELPAGTTLACGIGQCGDNSTAHIQYWDDNACSQLICTLFIFCECTSCIR